MSRMAVGDAAARLGLSASRVRQMLADGVLRGERIGRSWVIEQSAIDAIADERPGVGRPWQPQSAWALLAVAGGDEAEGSAVERFRARDRLAEHGLAGLVGRLSARCEVRRFYAHPAVLDDLAGADDVVLGGISAAGHCGADVIAAGVVDAYVKASMVDALIDRYALDERAERPNVIVRVVDDEFWSFAANERFAPWPVVAADLLESDDARSRRAGAELAARR
ncbi:MAG: helix-turn-helix domain-containing protein [Actinobacteria bacterium]|nr:helix-turn-helix domain-containing protein [Actinomycetota bacterium]MSX88366.1 helix-turn-helix domain-containing protein [Actinomycetota bacterium]MSY73395.1 helix-turn-helix domain-containing protein [Actinomycetota bacterium]